MLVPNLLPKVVPHSGSRLLPRFIVRTVDDWLRASHASTPGRPGRPALLADSEILTLAILAQ
jgi:predicted hotdog family 3-hydroxylacyl-ACP dehydratase